MSKYTTEVRFICEEKAGLLESKGVNDIDTIVNKAYTKIFKDFPLFDEAYRSTLCTKILKHYYTREISEETVGLWTFRLNTKMNEIMPYYNQLYKSQLYTFNPLYTVNLTTTHQGDVKNTTNETYNDILSKTGTKTTETTGTVDNNTTSTNASSMLNAYSDTPQGAITNLENNTYLTNATKETNSDNGTNNTHNIYDTENKDTFNTQDKKDSNRNGLSNTTENYLENVVGYQGKDASELLLKFRKTFLNIDMQIIEELEPLFFGLW